MKRETVLHHHRRDYATRGSDMSSFFLPYFPIPNHQQRIIRQRVVSRNDEYTANDLKT